MSLTLAAVLFWGVSFLILIAIGCLLARSRRLPPLLQRVANMLAEDEPEWAREFEQRMRERSGRP